MQPSVVVLQTNPRRKRKTTGDENLGQKTKNKRYRRGCVADEVPSTILLENSEDEDEAEDEEPGEIVDEQAAPFEPFNYEAMHEKKILSNSKLHCCTASIRARMPSVARSEKFKRPADDEDIYEPNRRKKATSVRVMFLAPPPSSLAHRSALIDLGAQTARCSADAEVPLVSISKEDIDHLLFHTFLSLHLLSGVY